MNKLSCQEYQKLIGNRIKQYRVNAGVSQKDLESNIELLIPDQTKRPSFYLKDNNKPKQRVRKKKENNGTFKWRDEE